MGPSLFVQDPAACRFIAGTWQEAEHLFGSPLPPLPHPDVENGRPIYTVRFPPRLSELLGRWLQVLLRQIGGQTQGRPAAPDAGGREQSEYEAALQRVLRSVRQADRLQGVENLCWLALSRDVAEAIRSLEQKDPSVKKLKYNLHPILSSLFRRLRQSVRRVAEKESPGRERLLSSVLENGSLADAIIEDGFAFTERAIADVDFNQFLAANKRYRLSADLFFEIYTVLTREAERRLRQGDRGLMARVSRHLPGLTRDHWQSHSGVVKVAMNEQVLMYLLADCWGTGSQLLASSRLKAEAAKRPASEVMDAFLDVVAGVKRFEIVSHLRERVCLVRPFTGQGQVEERVARGHRLYEFGESAQVLNNAVNVTVLFLDLRGFTRTSEGHISEKGLTEELYAVFDEFVPHIRRFGGTIDKFLGDGIMATFGTERADELSPLNAVRAALLCQESLRGLRQDGRTVFKMGVAVHYGRVYQAHFIASETAMQSTVIGRNVNLAGRLSSAAKQPLDEDEEQFSEVLTNLGPGDLQVTVDHEGTLFNEGIAVSRDALAQLEAHVAVTHVSSGDASQREYFDEEIGRRIRFRYCGDAKFKGVRSSVPVYAVHVDT